MLKIKYPVSLNNLNGLKEGDKIEYYGKLVFIHPKSISRLYYYYKMEHLLIYNFMREIVISGILSNNYIINFQKIDDLYLDFILKNGGNTAVFPKFEKNRIMKKHKRPFLVYEGDKIYCKDVNQILHKDIKEGGLSECWVDGTVFTIGYGNSKKRKNIKNA